MADKHSADEAFVVWQKRTFHDNQGESLVLLERDVWRAACAYQQAADVEIVEDVRHCIGVDLTAATDDGHGWDQACIEIKRRITGEKE